MFISFIVTLTVGVLCAIFLGAFLSSLLNTFGIAGAYPFAAPFIFAAIFAAVYFFVHQIRLRNGYSSVAEDYPDGGYSLSGDLKKIVRSERGFYILVGVGALIGWFFRLIDTAVTRGVGGGLISYGAYPFAGLTVLPDTFAVYPRTAGNAAASIWMYALNVILICAVYTAILALARKRWYTKHMELHRKERDRRERFLRRIS